MKNMVWAAVLSAFLIRALVAQVTHKPPAPLAPLAEPQETSAPIDFEVVSVDKTAHTVTIRIPQRHVYTPIGLKMTMAGPASADYEHIVPDTSGKFISTPNGGSMMRLVFEISHGQKLQWVGGFRLTALTITQRPEAEYHGK